MGWGQDVLDKARRDFELLSDPNGAYISQNPVIPGETKCRPGIQRIKIMCILDTGFRRYDGIYCI